MSGFLVDDFDPREMQRDGLKMVLEVKPNEVQRYMEDDEHDDRVRRPRGPDPRLDLGRASRALR